MMSGLLPLFQLSWERESGFNTDNLCVALFGKKEMFGVALKYTGICLYLIEMRP